MSKRTMLSDYELCTVDRFEDEGARVHIFFAEFTDRLGFVVLSADHIQKFKLTRWQLEALIFHELGHFKWEDGVLNTYGHDFEAFRSEVEEYGLWKPDLELASAAFKQIELPGVKTGK